MAEEQDGDGPRAEGTKAEPKDDLIPRAEAKKAFEARDKAKKLADELQKKLDAIETERQAAEAKAEEERLKKAGEWDAMKQSLVTKHQAELETERKARQALETSYVKEKIEAAFLAASDWFGGETAKTILTGPIAYKAFGEHVSYEDVDLNGKTVKQIVVRDLENNIIVDGKGNPAKFVEAIGELISQLPDKDRILRGSGKTGSGSSGGGAPGSPIDFRNLTPEQRRDPKVLAQLRAQLPKGGVVMGEAYQS